MLKCRGCNSERLIANGYKQHKRKNLAKKYLCLDCGMPTTVWKKK